VSLSVDIKNKVYYLHIVGRSIDVPDTVLSRDCYRYGEVLAMASKAKLSRQSQGARNAEANHIWDT